MVYGSDFYATVVVFWCCLADSVFVSRECGVACVLSENLPSDSLSVMLSQMCLV